MKRVFADTFYFLALINARDTAHEKAVSFIQSYVGHIVTSSWVILELADALSSVQNRQHFQETWNVITNDPNITIIEMSQQIQNDAIDLYLQRADKNWSLTDCVSFRIMHHEGLSEALTGDKHFEQAGFQVLLK